MDCRPRLTSSINPWFRIRVYLLLDGLPTKAIELHLPGFEIRSCPSPRLCRSTAPYSVLFRCNPPEGGLPNPPPRGRAPTPYSPIEIWWISEFCKRYKFSFEFSCCAILNIFFTHFISPFVKYVYEILHEKISNALYHFYSRFDTYQKTQLVNKNRTLAFSMK